ESLCAFSDWPLSDWPLSDRLFSERPLLFLPLPLSARPLSSAELSSCAGALCSLSPFWPAPPAAGCASAGAESAADVGCASVCPSAWSAFLVRRPRAVFGAASADASPESAVADASAESGVTGVVSTCAASVSAFLARLRRGALALGALSSAAG